MLRALRRGQDATLGDIATEVGVSRATVYRYFEGGRDEVISTSYSARPPTIPSVAPERQGPSIEPPE